MIQRVPDKLPNIEYRNYAFHHAASLTRHYGAELTVIHVVQGGPELDKRLFGYVDEKLWEEIKTQNLEEAKGILISRKRDNAAIKECVGQFCEDVQASIPDETDITYSVVVKMGDPVELVIEEAETGTFDLIVMGSHGHGPLRAAMMGDTVRRVVKRSKIPVLVVRVPE
jgi:nucleotide-binding universal stress UspA family protein